MNLKKCLTFCILFSILVISANTDEVIEINPNLFVVYGNQEPIGDWVKIQRNVYASYILLSSDGENWRIGIVYYVVKENFI